MREPQVIDPGKARNVSSHLLGAAAMLANKLRYALAGYHHPRDFPTSRIARAVEYDLGVVGLWQDCLAAYLGRPLDLRGRSILELGPGADLGNGLILLARGAAAYQAVDAHDLIGDTPPEFYDALLERLAREGADAPTVAALAAQLPRARSDGGALRYFVRPDFDLRTLPAQPADLIVSQAAFEHFEDPDATIRQLGPLARPGCVFLAAIDFQTHIRPLRQRDPLNVYRYSDWFYRLARFPGQPNRLRPADYRRILGDHGWRDVRSWPLTLLEPGYVEEVRPWLNKRFSSLGSEMEILGMVICASRP